MLGRFNPQAPARPTHHRRNDPMSAYAEFHRRSIEDRDAFWAEQAKWIDWQTQPQTICDDSHPPFTRWFAGGTTNLCHNAVDRHLAARAEQAALVFVSTEVGLEKTYSFAELHAEVQRMAAMLQALGVGTGDRVQIYMPMVPEAMFAMLACARIGAIHSVVFGGFASGSLASRIEDAEPKLIVSADAGSRGGKVIPYKPLLDEAIRLSSHKPAAVLMVDRGLAPMALVAGRDHDYATLRQQHLNAQVPCVWVDATHTSYTLYTSGTTGRPKGVQRDTGGYAVALAASLPHIFMGKPGETFFCTSDIGWVVGHSYIVYAPLMAGTATLAYEGAIDHPDADAVWTIIDAEEVTGLFSSPTAIRLLMRYGDDVPRRHDLSRLERAFSAGEVLNAPAWEWLQQAVFGDRVPVIDHMWQTETGGPIFGNPFGYSLLPIKPGSAGVALPGIEADVVDQDGKPVGVGEKGIMRIKRPFPGLIATLWGEPERYVADYWDRIPGGYYVGVAAHVDEDGYVWFAGRADEIIKISGHRLGTIEVETAFLRHPAVAEAGVTGVPDELRGEVIDAFVALKAGHEPSDELHRELLQTVRHELGPVAVIGHLSIVSMLPKTRSGKIMRRVLKAVALERDPGDISTIEDEGSVDEARRAVEEMRAGIIT